MIEHDLDPQPVDSKANPNFGFCENARHLESQALHKTVETPQAIDSKALRKTALCENALQAIELEAKLKTEFCGNADPKEYTALAHDAAGFAAHGHDAATSLATLFQAIARLAGANQLVRELAALGETMADELSEAAEDTRTRYMLEADRYGAPPTTDPRG